MRRGAALLTAGVLAGVALQWSEFQLGPLMDGRGWSATAGFVRGFWPVATDGPFLALLWRSTLETLAIATAGTALAVAAAAPLAVFATAALSTSRIGPARHAWVASGVRWTVRLAMTGLRGVPEIVWALLIVRAVGLGPGAGLLAIALTYAGMLGKVYTEILESADARPVTALLQAGSGRIGALLYGALPMAGRELVSYTVYRWECAVRASVVMGFVGAGGLGQLMDQSMKMLNGGEASAILLTFLGLVLMADALSAGLRAALR